MTANPLPFVRSDLLLSDVRPSSIDYLLRSEKWSSPRRGLYVDQSIDLSAQRLATLRAHLLRMGPLSGLSHHSAAAIHGFDSTSARPTGDWIVGPHDRRMVPAEGLRIVRSRGLLPHEFTEIDGLFVTSRARTVLDLAAIVDDHELERIIESALRGPDPKQPAQWRTAVLDELQNYISGNRRRPGATSLARVLKVRGNPARLTGSIAETAVVQALRRAGEREVIRQPTLRIYLSDGSWTEVYPDTLIPRRRLIVELDGSDHVDLARWRADLARQNKLMIGFNVARYTGAAALYDSDRVVAEIKQFANREPAGEGYLGYSWTECNRTVTGRDVEWTIRPTK